MSNSKTPPAQSYYDADNLYRIGWGRTRILFLDPLNGRLAQLPHCGSGIFRAKNRGTRDDDFRSSLNNLLNGVEIYAAVDFNTNGQSALVDYSSQAAHLVDGCRNELLASKARID